MVKPTFLFWLSVALSSVVSAAPAQRIVSLVPHATEMLFAIDAGERVIAVDESSDYPAAANQLPKVANYRSLNVEQILALAPDLIVVWDSAQRQQVQPLAQLGIPVFYSEPQNFAALADELVALSELTGTQQQAAAVVAQYQQELADLTVDYAEAKPISVFYQIASSPLMSANNTTWMGQAIELCGGVNIMGNSPAPYPQVNAEQVLAQDPKVIVAGNSEDLQRWQQWPALTAVANKQLLTIDTNLLNRFTIRTPQGIRTLCQQLDKARVLTELGR